MAFITEDGSGTKGATAYGTVDQFKAYHADRGNDISAIADPAGIQQALIAAADYIDTRWGPKFKGRKEHETFLKARAVLTLTAVPLDGETVTVGTTVFTFRTTPLVANEVGIGATAVLSLANLQNSVSSFFTDRDAAALTIYATEGDAMTETLSNGSFDVAVAAGSSNYGQPLEFPRAQLYDGGRLVEGVPFELREAAFEYALRASTAALAPDPTVDAAGQVVAGSRQKVGPIETEITYAVGGSSPSQITRPYPAADRLLANLVHGTVGVIR